MTPSAAHVLVQATPERSRMRGRRAHAGLLRHRDRLLIRHGDGSVGGDRTVIDGESDGRRSGSGGVEIDASRRRWSMALIVIFFRAEEGRSLGIKARTG